MNGRYGKPLPPDKSPPFFDDIYQSAKPDGDPQPPLKGVSTPPVYNLSKAENDLWQANLDKEHWYLFVLEDFISKATEHIAIQLIPVYNAIRSATTVDQLILYTMHERSIVRHAATQKIELLTNFPYSPKIDLVDQGYSRWPGNAWESPRKPS